MTDPTGTTSAVRERDLPQDQGSVVWARKAWSAPLAFHGAVLFVLMVGVAAFIGTGATFTDDEGAGILQAQAIEHGHWTVANPLPQVDPTGAAYPIHQPARGTRGNAPVGKNLAYFVVLALLGLALGTAGMVGLSIAGTVASALLSARLARELGASERATFWLVGLASPLFFDGFLVVAHTIASALVVGSALLGLRFLRDGRLATFAGAVACVGVATLFRTEAALWALGLAAGALVSAVWPGTKLGSGRRSIVLAAGSTAAMLVARGANSVITHKAIGSSVSAPPGTVPSTGASGTVNDQVQGLLRSWFELKGAPAAAFTLIIVLLALATVWARASRHGRAGVRSTVALAGSIAAFSIYLAIRDPSHYIAGIAVVFPVFWVGLWLLGRPTLRDPASRLLVTASAVFAFFVAGTEYSDAGAWQPGRYFFLCIPVMVPVIVPALAAVLGRLAPAARTIAVASVLLGMLATTTSAVDSLRVSHQRSGGLGAFVTAIAADAAPGDGRRPVVVTTEAFLPRSEWSTFDSVRWQLVSPTRLTAYGTALSRAGIHRFILVTLDPIPELDAFRATYTPVKTEPWTRAPQWRLVVLQRA